VKASAIASVVRNLCDRESLCAERRNLCKALQNSPAYVSLRVTAAHRDKPSSTEFTILVPVDNQDALSEFLDVVLCNRIDKIDRELREAGVVIEAESPVWL
jgi:hypothetical protein